MIEIDGSLYSGSGTILRYAVGLCALLGKELHIKNIRAKGKPPGLRPQHLKSILACNELVEGEIEHAEIGSSILTFKPGKNIKTGEYQWDIGTAGSTTMCCMTVSPVLCFGKGPSKLKISGGLFQDFAPSAFHMEQVLFPQLKKMGIEVDLKIIRPGYVPEGKGIIEVEVQPVRDKLKPISKVLQGKIIELSGISLCSHLEKGRVSERMAESCNYLLKQRGYEIKFNLWYDDSALQKGAALFVCAKTDTGCLIGSDMAGKIGRSSEEIGRYVAYTLLEDLDSKATADRFLSDQLIIYAALAEGVSEYIIPRMTDHIKSNLWLVEEIIGAKTNVSGNHLKIEGVGFKIG
ncbi:MAG: RNA 3'-terminal phosphate cyclase [bacterium]|nr:RNA 3'-terminal phosphate cyclase [bacterium]